ncbi:uncharacterized protein UHOD_12114 [Ustilago sp. UG-2017b]|nr:uncharacterized protein UHOD_12114 [Ustilago sp. UG-2017b]
MTPGTKRHGLLELLKDGPKKWEGDGQFGCHWLEAMGVLDAAYHLLQAAVREFIKGKAKVDVPGLQGVELVLKAVPRQMSARVEQPVVAVSGRVPEIQNLLEELDLVKFSEICREWLECNLHGECSLHGDHGHGGLGPYARRSKHRHNEDRAQGACRRLPLRGSRDKSQRNRHRSKEEEQCKRQRPASRS